MRKIVKRSCRSLVDTTGYVDLPTACIRANQTGFFGLSQRVNPESFDGETTDIDPRNCFFGGRRVDLAVKLRAAEDLATKASGSPASSSDDAGFGTSSGQSE